MSQHDLQASTVSSRPQAVKIVPFPCVTTCAEDSRGLAMPIDMEKGGDTFATVLNQIGTLR